MSNARHLNILGIRGIPAAHGGFETFAAHFAPYMSDSGWTVTVYCQEEEGVVGPQSWTDTWADIERIHFQTRSRGALATIEFDLRCVLHVLGRPGIDLVLGYNTAVFNVIQRLFGRRVIMNMDGIEWKRRKWGLAAKAWFWLNERIGARICTVPIADHPEIAAHLAAGGCRRAVVIPYGAAPVTAAPVAPVEKLGLEPRRYFISIARIEPENSILEMVKAFGRADTGGKFVVLGRLTPDQNPYHAAIASEAGPDVIFPGAIYDQAVVQALRVHSLAYMHGHQVGGTNPSLVEALGAGAPVVAHDNRFNRWTAGEDQLFFADVDECAERMQRLAHETGLRDHLSTLARRRHAGAFTFPLVHGAYRDIMEKEAFDTVLVSEEEMQ